MKNIGFIGLGIMGESMCERIIKSGLYSVCVYDINKVQVDKLVSLGATAATSLSDVAEQSGCIIIMVPNNSYVKEVIQKLLPNLKKDTVIIDMSTISPEVSVELSEKVKDKGCLMADAPVVKSKAAAISGDLGIYVGCDAESFDKIKPVLSCMGKNIIRMGNNGSGLIMKLCHNMLVAQIQNGVNEMITLAQSVGIDIDSFSKAISYGGGQNFYLDTKADAIKNMDFSPKFPFEHMAKDIGLTVEMIKQKNLNLPGTEVVKNVFSKGMEKGLQREDFSASYKIVSNKE